MQHMNTCNWSPGSLLHTKMHQYQRCAKWLQVHTQTPNSSKALAPANADAHPQHFRFFTCLQCQNHATSLDQLIKIHTD